MRDYLLFYKAFFKGSLSFLQKPFKGFLSLLKAFFKGSYPLFKGVFRGFYAFSKACLKEKIGKYRDNVGSTWNQKRDYFTVLAYRLH